jgi:hypothetical protein
MKPRVIVFVGGPEKERWIRGKRQMRRPIKTRFVQEPYKLNSGSEKIIYPGTTSFDFSVIHIHTF